MPELPNRLETRVRRRVLRLREFAFSPAYVSCDGRYVVCLTTSGGGWGLSRGRRVGFTKTYRSPEAAARALDRLLTPK